MATTRNRPRGREAARPNSGGVAAEHMTKIWGAAIGGVVVIIAFLALTGTGHVIDLAVQHFMLYYAGVFALIGLCASVGAGLIATDRIILNPGHRVWAQSAHRAISFGALTFLIIHIVSEILAQRAHVIDAVVPFLSPFRTFYIGLGTISSDLVILLVITGILRKRFTSNGENVWRWRAIHYTSYLSFVFGIWHGLLGGRPGKPYVDWSYGFVIAFVALALAVRILAQSLRPKESLSAPPVPESAGSGSAPIRAAALLAQASATQIGAGRGMVPAGMTALGSAPAASGPMRAIPALPAGGVGYYGGPGYEDAGYPGYEDAGYGVPGYETEGYGPVGYEGPGHNQAVMRAAPVYEPGYEGPPRFQGAPRPGTGPMPQVPGRPVVPDSTVSGPLPQVSVPPGGGYRGRHTGPMPQAPGASREPYQGHPSGPLPRVPGPPSGPIPRVPGPPSGPVPRVPGSQSMPGMRGGFPRSGTGPVPRVQGPGTGGFQRPVTGPVPQAAPGSAPGGPASRVQGPPSGGFQRPRTGPMPRVPGEMRGPRRPPMPRPVTGPAGYDDPGYREQRRRDADQDAGYGFPGGDEPR